MCDRGRRLAVLPHIDGPTFSWGWQMGAHLDTHHRNWSLSDLILPAEWASVWHVRKVFFPRRSIAGKLIRGTILRRHDGRKWIYKKMARSTDYLDRSPSKD